MSAVEETLDILESTPVPNARSAGKVALAFAVGAAIGAGVSWAVAQKVLSKKYEEKFDRELEESVKFLVANQDKISNLVVTNDTADETEEVVQEPLEEVEGERVIRSQEAKTPLEDLSQRNQQTNYNSFSTPQDFTGGEGEEIIPDEEPYDDPDISIISREIFEANGTEWPQETYTYFSDKGVVNLAGYFVVDPELEIGQRTPPFGQLSEDPHVVYLRNKRLEKEFEVIYDPGKAADLIMPDEDGEGDSLQHSLQRLQQKYRPEREL